MPGTTSFWRPLERGEAAELRGVPWRRHLARSLALLFVVMGSLDVVSTNAGLAAGYVEGNPVMRQMPDAHGLPSSVLAVVEREADQALGPSALPFY